MKDGGEYDKKFNRIKGRAIEEIYGQDRFGYSQSGFEDMYDLIQWSRQGGHQGSELLFYDFYTGKVYKPFDRKRNVIYGRTVYTEGFLYFLQGDYDQRRVILYRYMPEKISFPLRERESVIFIEDGKVYLEEWVEEGWDEEADCATAAYKYYNQIIVKDFEGKTISKEIGCLNQDANGGWWIS